MVPLFISSVCQPVCVFVTFVVFTDYESCKKPISTNPGSMEAGEYAPTRGMCFAARRLELIAVAWLLWISWCVLGTADFFVTSYFVLFFHRTHTRCHTNGTVERMMREVIHGANTMFNEGRRPLNEWVVVLPAVQWALNMAWRRRVQATPYHVMMVREPRTASTALTEGDDDGFQLSPIDEERLQKLVVSLADTQEELLAGVLPRVNADRRHHRARGTRGKTLPRFTVGDYVLVGRPSRQGKDPKLMSTWTRPWRVANDDEEHAYTVQHFVTAELRDVHMARMRLYADDQLEITGEVLKVFQQFENQGKYHIRSISAIKRASSGNEFAVKVAWEGLEEVDST